MRSWYNTLRQLNTSYAAPFDWAITLPASLAPSFDILVQNLQKDLRELSDPTKHEEIAQRITSTIMAEGQRKEKKDSDESALFAQNGRNGGFKPRKGESSRQNSSIPTTQAGPSGSKSCRGKCNYCHNEGHWERECRKKIRDGKKKEEKAAVVEKEVITVHAMMAADGHLDVDWISDSGAESHFAKNAIAFSTYRKVSNQIVKGAGGTTFPILGRGDIKAYFIGPTKQKTQILLRKLL